MKKLLSVLLLLMLVAPLFSGAFYPEISLNKSVNLLLNKNHKLKFPTDDQKSPFYAFSYFPGGLGDETR